MFCKQFNSGQAWIEALLRLKKMNSGDGMQNFMEIFDFRDEQELLEFLSLCEMSFRSVNESFCTTKNYFQQLN